MNNYWIAVPGAVLTAMVNLPEEGKVKFGPDFDYLVGRIDLDFQSANVSGQKQLLSVYGAQSDFDAILAEFPIPNLIIIGAWDFEGLPLGMDWTLDQDGNRIGIEGVAAYAMHPGILKFIPDIKTYDVDGNLISSTPVTDLSTANLYAGQGVRWMYG